MGLTKCQLVVQKAEGSVHSGTISAAEFDRLGFLLRGSFESNAAKEGSPMDVSPSPFQGQSPASGL